MEWINISTVVTMKLTLYQTTLAAKINSWFNYKKSSWWPIGNYILQAMSEIDIDYNLE